MRKTTRDKPPAQANRASQRRSERFQRQFHSEGFVRFTKHCSCVACGRKATAYELNECSHHPNKSGPEAYKKVHPLCADCHRLGPKAYHKGKVTFQRHWNIDLDEENRRHWKAFQEWGEEWP